MCHIQRSWKPRADACPMSSAVGSSWALLAFHFWFLSVNAASNNSWVHLSPTGSLPIGRHAHTAVVDQARGRMLAFAGDGGNGVGYLNDLHVYNIARNNWAPLSPTGAKPHIRYDHTAVLDESRERMLVFGGNYGVFLEDLHAYSLTSNSWTQLTPSGNPPSGRIGATAVLDQARDQMVIFGGNSGHKLYSYSLAANSWTAFSSTGTPQEAIYQHSAVLDKAGGQMLIFGGTDRRNWQSTNNLYAYNLAGNSWQQLSPTGTLPSARSAHTAVMVETTGQMLIFGGYSGGSNQNDLYSYLLSGNSWVQLSPPGNPPSPIRSHTAAFHAGRMLVFSGKQLHAYGPPPAPTPAPTPIPLSDQFTQKGIDLKGVNKGETSGWSISLSSDGNILAILGRGGYVRVYEWASTAWRQQGFDIVHAPDFCNAVALSSNGNILAIGAPGSGNSRGQVRVYEWVYYRGNTRWIQKGATIDGDNETIGWSVALSSDGNILAIGAPFNDGPRLDSGRVCVYEWASTVWTQKGADIDGEAIFDESGMSIALSSDGNILAIGARYNSGTRGNHPCALSGHVRMYQWSSTAWTQKGADIDGEAARDYFGTSVALSSDGNIVAIGARRNDGAGRDSGHVRVYEWTSTAWTQKGVDIDGEAAMDYSGMSVAVSSDGNILAIGAPWNDGAGMLSGHVRVYEWASSAWTQKGIDVDGKKYEGLGQSVALSSDGSNLAVGGVYDGGWRGGVPYAGVVRVFEVLPRTTTTTFNTEALPRTTTTFNTEAAKSAETANSALGRLGEVSLLKALVLASLLQI